jgi:pimeloyl-ACP methyl ester carboxylesterase
MRSVRHALGLTDAACAPAARATLWLLLLAACAAGCAQQSWVRLREVPDNPLAGPLNLLSPSGPKPTARTMLLVRRYDLEDELKRHSSTLLPRLYEITNQEPSADKLYALSELAYLAAKRVEPINRQRALELHGLAMVNGYNYLFDERFGRFRNPYDPEFRGACDLYNGALESALRIINRRGGLVPGATQTIRTANQTIEATVVLRGHGWRSDDFAGFRFVSDYEVNGLQNHYHTYGLGVPLIGVRKRHDGAEADEKYYPPGMSFPVTAFLRVLPERTPGSSHHVAQLELHDPLNASELNVDGRRVPLESDLTTPLAYALNQKELRDLDSSTAGLLNPAKTEKLQGLYMLEPYQPGKIPVIMIHGVWSSPITWMAMFNDLRGAPEVRSRYQFWFYLYPSGQPFWYSAADLRRDLIEARHVLDPGHRQVALDQMVLVGHSMGGLLARLQTIDSGDAFWRTVSERPFHLIKASNETRQELAGAFFFRPSSSVRRVITIGTPYRGSEFANSTTRWLGSKLIRLPKMFTDARVALRKDNPDLFKEPSLIDVDTSIDALAPDSPFLPVMLKRQPAPWVRHHTIIGIIPEKGLLGRIAGEGDGVVSVASAHLDQVDSEITINADHTTIHSHPLSVLEVHRILLAHLAEVDRPPQQGWPRVPMTAAAPPGGQWAPQRPPTAVPVLNQAPYAPNVPWVQPGQQSIGLPQQPQPVAAPQQPWVDSSPRAVQPY